MKYLIILVFLFIHSAFAQWNEINSGLYGGVVHSIVNYGDNFYVASNGGIYRTDNSFENYEKILIDNRLLKAECLDIVDGKMFVGTNEGLYISADMGISWTKADLGLERVWIYSFSIENGNIFVGTNGKGVYYSSDYGNSWEAKNTGIEKEYVSSISVHNNNVFIGTDDNAFISTDYGLNWRKIIENGNYNFVYDASASDLGYFFINAEGFFASYDYGENWEKITENTEELRLNGMKAYGDKLYLFKEIGGLYIFEDNEITPLSINSDTQQYSIYDLYIDLERIIISTHTGVYISENEGETYIEKNQGLTNSVIRGIISTENELFISADRRILHSSNDGESWVLKSIPSESSTIDNLSLINNHLFAGSWQKIFRSSDMGNNWEELNAGEENLTVFLQIIGHKDKIFAATWRGLFVSTDNGDTWENNTDEPFNNGLATLEQNNEKIFAGNWRGVFISSDGGENWTKPEDVDSPIISIKAKDDFIIASSYVDILISEDNGINWEIIENPFDGTGAFRMIIVDDYIFAATSKGVFVSNDKGRTWENKSEGLHTISVFRLAVKDNYIYAGTNGSGLYKASLDDFNKTGVKTTDLSNYAISIRPNPASDYIEISLSSHSVNKWLQPLVHDGEIEIYDVLGNRVWKSTLNTLTPTLSLREMEQRFDISHLPRGVYYVRVGERVEKFVKK